MLHVRILQFNPQVACTQRAFRNVNAQGRRDVKLGRLPGLNLVRVERCRLRIYAFFLKAKLEQEYNDRIGPIVRYVIVILLSL